MAARIAGSIGDGERSSLSSSSSTGLLVLLGPATGWGETGLFFGLILPRQTGHVRAECNHCFEKQYVRNEASIKGKDLPPDIPCGTSDRKARPSKQDRELCTIRE